MPKTWERRLQDAKKKHRPKHADWSCDGFATRRREEFLRQAVIQPRALNMINHAGIARVKYGEITAAEFARDFEKPYRPCVIEDIPRVDGWTAPSTWTFSELKKRFGDRLFKCGEDDDGYKIKHRMKYFLQYAEANTDDSPLYIFDGAFDNDVHAKSMLSDYSIPRLFTDDLFSLVGEEKRPPYRWFLFGPERSGSEVHIDPLGTSAWNTVISGRKRWVLFPPSVPRSVAKGLDCIKKGEDDEAINYFVDILPRVKEKYGHQYPIIEFIQEPGETCFIPGGWWHGVLNLEHSVAITQNFCSYSNFDAVWRKTRSGRKKMAVKWLRKLRTVHPTLAARAEELNAQDEFQMYVSKRKRKREEERKAKETAQEDEGRAVVSPVDSANKKIKVHKAMRKSSEDKKKKNGSKLKKAKKMK